MVRINSRSQTSSNDWFSQFSETSVTTVFRIYSYYQDSSAWHSLFSPCSSFYLAPFCKCSRILVGSFSVVLASKELS